jgi:hypothetical protein
MASVIAAYQAKSSKWIFSMSSFLYREFSCEKVDFLHYALSSQVFVVVIE